MSLLYLKPRLFVLLRKSLCPSVAHKAPHDLLPFGGLSALRPHGDSLPSPHLSCISSLWRSSSWVLMATLHLPSSLCPMSPLGEAHLGLPHPLALVCFSPFLAAHHLTHQMSSLFSQSLAHEGALHEGSSASIMDAAGT